MNDIREVMPMGFMLEEQILIELILYKLIFLLEYHTKEIEF